VEIKIVRQILEWNEDCHQELQTLFNEKKILVINIMGSPGGGKTTLITKIIENLKAEYNIGVIEADLAGQIDAEKIDAMGIPVVQLNTEGACHIEAMSIKSILPHFDLDELDILIIENVGNLVCPAEFEIGEDIKIALLSIPEGDDKVEKYPLMFTKCDALVLTKYDMADYFDFKVGRVEANARAFNKEVEIFKVNSVRGTGMEKVLAFIRNRIKK
jgi:hydrogenase nickel incorporation protein HypB